MTAQILGETIISWQSDFRIWTAILEHFSDRRKPSNCWLLARKSHRAEGTEESEGGWPVKSPGWMMSEHSEKNACTLVAF